MWLQPENHFMSIQEHSVAYCRCRKSVKLLGFLLYSLIGTSNNVQNCALH